MIVPDCASIWFLARSAASAAQSVSSMLEFAASMSCVWLIWDRGITIRYCMGFAGCLVWNRLIKKADLSHSKSGLWSETHSLLLSVVSKPIKFISRCKLEKR